MTGVLRMVFILSAKNKTIQPPTGRNIVKNRKRYILLCAACVAAGAHPPQYYHLFFIKTWMDFFLHKISTRLGRNGNGKKSRLYIYCGRMDLAAKTFSYIYVIVDIIVPFPSVVLMVYGRCLYIWPLSPEPSSRPQGSAPRRTNTKKWFFGTSLWHF